MSDPLDYMNRLLKWPDPPPFDNRWVKKVAHACEIISQRDAEIEQLKAQVAKLTKKSKTPERTPSNDQ